MPALGRWKKMLEEQGDFQDKPRRMFFRKIDPKKLEEHLNEHPDAYLREIAMVFGCSIAAVSKAIKSMGYTKKKRTSHTKNRMPKSSRVPAKNKGYQARNDGLYG
nr:IS630 transposase-related protein [uncultured Cloacibacillus sp.]